MAVPTEPTMLRVVGWRALELCEHLTLAFGQVKLFDSISWPKKKTPPVMIWFWWEFDWNLFEFAKLWYHLRIGVYFFAIFQRSQQTRR